ncbi:MAG: hypothetical protein CL916_03470 [Deltaproteobacteria bacterium]|nr:hypothetical protein [Deltaproteobacteria bacterium]
MSLGKKILKRRNTDLYWIGFSILFLSVASMLTPHTQSISVWGWKIPELCMYKRLLGLECFGCGITRSIVYTVHGEFSMAVEKHLLGIPIVAMVIICGIRSLIRFTLSK